MRKSKFNPTKIVGILKEYENGKTAEAVCREHGISTATLYNWRKKYGGLDATEYNTPQFLDHQLSLITDQKREDGQKKITKEVHR